MELCSNTHHVRVPTEMEPENFPSRRSRFPDAGSNIHILGSRHTILYADILRHILDVAAPILYEGTKMNRLKLYGWLVISLVFVYFNSGLLWMRKHLGK